MTVWGIFVYFFIGTLKIIAAFVGAGIPVAIAYLILRMFLSWLIDQDWFW